jgi:hypothetical protein
MYKQRYCTTEPEALKQVKKRKEKKKMIWFMVMLQRGTVYY